MKTLSLFTKPVLILICVAFFATPILLIAQEGTETTATGDTQTQEPAAQTQEPGGGEGRAYQFKNEGIFGCNQVAGANASAGTMAAIGGVYVPVNDAAVTLNTGILVYKECVLRPLQNRLRESAMSALEKRNLIGISTGRNGNPQYVVNRKEERAQVRAESVISTLTNEKILEKLRPEYKEVVRSSVATTYRAGEQPERQLECSYKGNAAEVIKGKVPMDANGIPNIIGSGALTVLTDPACNPIGEYSILARITAERANEAEKDWEATIAEGRGFYPVTNNAEDPLAEKILTPASVVQSSFQNVFDSPVRQLESADDVGQMIGALFAGITTQALTDKGGLAGLLQSNNGQPSYLEQVARESSQGVIGAATNAALQILRAYRGFENRYLVAMNAIATSLTQAINQLRAEERACFDRIIPAAEEYADQNGFQITPVRLTSYSQQVINSQISPLSAPVLVNIASSTRALRLIDELIASVTNTASTNAQRIALQQLDNLAANNAFHDDTAADTAEEQRAGVASTMEETVSGIVEGWKTAPDAATGWCNLENQNIPRLWAEQWRRR